MEELKSVFAEAVTFTSTKKLWKARHTLCTMYDPEDLELCYALDRAVMYLDLRIAEITNCESIR